MAPPGNPATEPPARPATQTSDGDGAETASQNIYQSVAAALRYIVSSAGCIGKQPDSACMRGRVKKDQLLV